MRLLPVACAALFASTLTFAAGAAWACSCAPPPPPPVAREGAAHVFEGKVTAGPTSPRPGPDGAVSTFAPVGYTFEVARSWKGGLSGSVELFTAGNSAACGRSFEVGATYLVYASLGEDGKVRDSLCSRTRRGEPAQEDIAVLGEPEAVGAPTQTGGDSTQQGEAGTEQAAATEERPGQTAGAGAAPPAGTNGGDAPSDEPPPAEEEPAGKDPADPTCSAAAAPAGSSLGLLVALLAAAPRRRRR